MSDSVKKPERKVQVGRRKMMPVKRLWSETLCDVGTCGGM